MIRGIDHLVIACEHPEAAAAELESALGITCTGGGRHAGRGTWNRIAWLADGSYLELIGIDDADAASRDSIGAATLRTLEQQGPGLVTYALVADDLERTTEGLREAGSPIGRPIHGSRMRADGEKVEWWTAFGDRPLAADAPPFLIQHAAVGAEWGPAALEERARYRHPIGSAVVLARLDIATDDPPSTAEALHGTLGLEAWAVADLAVIEIGRHVLRFVPRREMAVPAVITIAADVDAPRTVDVLGLRFDVERVRLPVPAPNPA